MESYIYNKKEARKLHIKLSQKIGDGLSNFTIS